MKQPYDDVLNGIEKWLKCIAWMILIWFCLWVLKNTP